MIQHSTRRVASRARTLLLALTAVALASSVATAQQVVNLIAAPFTKNVTLPNGTVVAVPMWGFALDANGDGILDPSETPSVPGPRIVVAPGTSSLTVTITRNLLPEAVSIVIPGQQASGSPVVIGGRIRSQAPEAPPNGSQSYSFSSLKPGTFLYQSGSHQAVQVQMGLYGALSLDAAAGLAYTAVPYGSETVLLLSEVDVALHQAVSSGTYGTSAGPTSTIDYAPSLFLINGESYRPDLAALGAGAAGSRSLLRLLNAGQESHVIALAPPTRDTLPSGATPDDTKLFIVAEDGNRYSDGRAQATLLLPAGKTHDVIWTPPAGGTYAVYDRALRLEAADQAAGGMLAQLKVADSAAATPTVPSAPDTFATSEDTPLVIAAPGVLANDGAPAGAVAELYSVPAAGTLVLSNSGNFVYTPLANFAGIDAFWYRARSGSDVSAPTPVTIRVAAVNDPPSALPLSLAVTAGGTRAVNRGAVDPDGDALAFYITQLPDPAHGFLRVGSQTLTAANLYGGSSQLAIPGGKLSYVATTTGAGTDLFQFLVRDAAQASPAAAVNVTVDAAPTEAVTGTELALQVLGVDPRTPGAAPVQVTDFRWTLEEDRTYDVQPGTLDAETLSVGFHRSYMPVLQSGDTTDPDPARRLPHVDTLSGKRYFVSVLPKSGYANGGVPIAAGHTSATVYVNNLPTPTAQIRVRVFKDDAPLNNAFDSDEAPLVGFNVSLDDAGGRYGISGGQMLQDAFGNPLGTTYKACSTGPGTCTDYQVDKIGNGFLLTDAQGFATFQNLRPGKYTVKVIPPPGLNWQQTSTIEGTKGIDAWVKANEPTFFTEFGPAGPHVEIGFVQPTNRLTAGVGRKTITGTITNLHQSRPPDMRMFSGAPFDYTRPWVGLYEGVAGSLLYVQPTGADGSFSIANVPPGSYTLAVFDSAVDNIFAQKMVLVPSGGTGTVALGDVPVFSWFTRLYHYVFDDKDKNGQRSADEPGIREVGINVRWRDGTVNQASATDGSGFLPFEETFPYFAWQIAEVDYTRFRATGVTVVVDNGGPLADTTWPDAVGAEADARVLAPQPQVKSAAWGDNENPTAGGRARTEVGPALLEGFQGFIGQTLTFLWGKTAYDAAGSHAVDVDVYPFGDFPGPNDVDWNANGKFDADEFNGGITGIVHYSTTRAENNARWGTPEPWEPGIAGVKVQLWNETRTQLLNEVVTDSWDDNAPTGCQGAVFSYLGQARDCYDGMRNWNQSRPAVFDGGYAFYTVRQDSPSSATYDLPFDQRKAERPLPAGKYVVKVIVPPGYKLVKEQDKNVDFGEEYVPQPFYLTGYPLADAGGAGDAPPPEGAVEDPLTAPFCVGDLQTVPAELSLFPGVPGAYAGMQMPTCDAKALTVRDGMNAAANFFLFTEAPIAGHIIGFVLDDMSNEFDPNSPQFGEKYAPPWLPVSIRDWTGREISRTYTDRYGVYNALVPSTFTASTPIPSGMTPSMLTACINSPLKADGTPDPFFNKQYSQFCYTLQYMPGATTYLDTPVVPTGAFAGPGQATLDAELPDKTPVIYSATQGTDPNAGIGPYIVSGTAAQRTIAIRSEGPTQVTNPAFDANLPDGAGNPKLITRDYGFGATKGQVWVGDTQIPAASVTWSDSVITAIVPSTTRTGELKVVRCLDNACTQTRPTTMGVTLTVATPYYHAQKPPKTVAPGTSIQAAVDAAQPGDLVLVPPGTYDEFVIMDKPVRLQGWGAPSTIINAVKTPAEKLQAWRDRVTATLGASASYMLPFQATELAALLPGDPDGELLGPILGGEGAPITVLGKGFPVLGGVVCPQIIRPFTPEAYGLQMENYSGLLFGIPIGGQVRAKARIDGFGLTGSDQAAGIEVNANACNLEVLNNRIYGNTGDFGSGVKIGHPGAVTELADEPAHNDYVTVAYNHILENTSLDYDAGGGVAIGTGATFYGVKSNFIAGNYTMGRGAGIAHIGNSTEGTIDHNTIVFNEVFNQDLAKPGGGIYIGGRSPAAGGLTPGAGNVVVSNNLIQGNAAIGDGGGIALEYVNGSEGARNRYRVDIFGNTIVDNVASLAGGGISLQDAVNVRIYHTTVARNDSLAVAGVAFPTPTQSTAQPAGIVSRTNSSALGSVGGASYSRPTIANSIVWQNRSFYYGQCTNSADPTCTIDAAAGAGVPAFKLFPTPSGTGHPVAGYWDFGVLGVASGTFPMTYSVATSLVGTTGAGNTTNDPGFVQGYFNGDRKQTITAPETNSQVILTPAAFDEGGNFIRPMFGPLTLNRLDTGAAYGNYHVNSSYAALPAAMRGQALFSGQITGQTGLFTNFLNVPQMLRSDADLPTGDSRTTIGVYPTKGADQVK